MKIPDEVKNIIIELQKNGFEAYIVGGCVRDLLMGNPPVGGPLAGGPKDWDITTNAKPEEIQRIFPDSFYENKFGTVGIKTTPPPSPLLSKGGMKGGVEKGEVFKIVEVTTFRAEAKYTDKRHPDEIKFVDSLEDDLKRRDFTINAMAILLGATPPPSPLSKGGMKGGIEIIDLFGGQKDLKGKIIRAVGNHDERFGEDALRMLRAVRFACELDFSIEPETFKAIQKNAGWLEAIAKERIKDEFEKIIMSPGPEKGVELLREAGLLKYIIPELELGIGVSQIGRASCRERV